MRLYAYHLLRAAPFGSDLEWSQEEFDKNFNELANVLGNLLNRTINMIKKYRGTVPAGAATEDIDRNLVAATAAAPSGPDCRRICEARTTARGGVGN